MKSEKGKGALRLLVLLALLAGFLYLAYDSMRSNKIKLGLDLAGGVSLTYQAKEENPSAQDLKDTIFKLQRAGIVLTSTCRVSPMRTRFSKISVVRVR